MRLYLGAGQELPSQQTSRDLIARSQDFGCSIGGYFWGYAGYSPQDSVHRALDLAASCGVTIPVLWIDVETDTDGSIPGAAWLRAADDEAVKLGQQIGAYSGRDFWKQIGDPGFPTWPLWSANYNGMADLRVPAYGNMQIAGHQWTDLPCDRNVFLAGMTT